MTPLKDGQDLARYARADFLSLARRRPSGLPERAGQRPANTPRPRAAERDARTYLAALDNIV